MPHHPDDPSHGGWGSEVDWETGTLRATDRTRDSDRTRGSRRWQPAPEPGILPKRPFTFFETMDGGFRLLRAAPAVTFGLAMIVYTLVTLGAGVAFAVLIMGNLGFLSSLMESPEVVSGFQLVAQTVALAGSFLSLSLTQLLAGCAAVAADAAVSRQRMSLAAVWSALQGRRLRLVLLTVVCFVGHLLLLGVLVLPGVLLVFADPMVGLIVTSLGVLVWVIATVPLFAKLALAGPAVAVEGLGIFAALTRSWDLTRKAMWKSLGQFALSYFLSSQVVSLIMSPILFILMAIAFVITLVFSIGTSDSGVESLIVSLLVGMGVLFTAVTIAATGLMFGYFSGVVATVYLDRRMRREGYDLVLLQRAEQDAARAADAADSTDPSAVLSLTPGHVQTTASHLDVTPSPTPGVRG